MVIAMVVGTVVSNSRNDDIPDATYLLVELCTQRAEGLGDYLVALDPMGAGPGELILVAQGSSARQTAASNRKPVDAIVVGIVDLIDERDELVYHK